MPGFCWIYSFFDGSFRSGFYTALSVDQNGLLLAGKCEKDGTAHLEIYDTQGHLLRLIDSYTHRHQCYSSRSLLSE